MSQTQPRHSRKRMTLHGQSQPSRVDSSYHVASQLVQQELPHTELVHHLQDLTLKQPGIVACGYYVAAHDAPLKLTSHHFDGVVFEGEEFRQRAEELATKTVQSGHAQSATDPQVRNLTLHAFPVAQRNRATDCWVVGTVGDGERSTSIAELQLLATQLQVSRERSGQDALTREIEVSAAVIELISLIEQSEDLQSAAQTLVDTLNGYLSASTVALCLKRDQDSGCEAVAISGESLWAAGTESRRRLEAACDESLVREAVTAWPGWRDEHRHASLAHKGLVRNCNANAAVSIPLITEDQRTIGVLAMTFVSTINDETALEQFLWTAQPRLASSIDIMRLACEGPFGRMFRRGRAARKWQTLKWAMGLSIAAGLLLLIPLPYKVVGHCVVEPPSKRFSVAPYEGLLERTVVRPGDDVEAGQLLAVMDDRELRWELAGLVAEREQAVRDHDVALADGDAAKMQSARFQMARIEARKRLVEHRLANTEIRATVAGTVLDGAQERQENARVSQGDPIFEIGSLDSITFEIAIPADDRTHIATGQEVEIAIDGMGNRTFPGTVQLIRPRSEIRDDENSFVVEVEVENPSGQLQPGMEGTARIVTDPHSLGWNLFHRAAEKISTAIQL